MASVYLFFSGLERVFLIKGLARGFVLERRPVRCNGHTIHGEP